MDFGSLSSRRKRTMEENGLRFSFFGEIDSHSGEWTSVLILREDRFP